MAGIDSRDQRDLVLAPGEYAHIMDKTKGQIVTYAGPNRASLSNTDEPVCFDTKTKRFRRVEGLNEAVQANVVAPEGYYVLLKNPAKDNAHPNPGTPTTPPTLEVGHKIIVHGPTSFVPWPGQMAKVVKGHHLRSNQYVLVRVYDEVSARANWGKGVLVGQEEKKVDLAIKPEELTTGKTLVIKGTDVSFYMPPTGVEVVLDEKGQFVREAVTLERLEYCVLINENGNKRNEQGPKVVFPEPTEVFKTTNVDREGQQVTTRKFRAYELTENSGIHLKVIAEYKDESVADHKIGEELFITGKERMIYFPREEQAIVKYEGREIHYAIAIPKGEARYVMDRNTGEITLKKGPRVFLPDPRMEVIVLRALEPKVCELLYPGNTEAMQHNTGLIHTQQENVTRGVGRHRAVAAMALGAGSEMIADAYMVSNAAEGRGLRGGAAKDFGGDTFDRKQQYTPPRTITLNTKYDGAVTTQIWAGYALMLVSKSGSSRVVQGPETVLLDYDENPQVLKLSTGTPKSGKTTIRTVFLRTKGKVSDIVEVETNDYCKVQVRLSYRINFEGDPKKWFTIEDYVGFLADHLRSRVRAGVQKLSIQEFYSNAVDLLRDIVLGKSEENKPRSGLAFEENGMRIYDLDVLSVNMEADLETRLIEAKRATFENGLAIQAKKQQVDFAKAESDLTLQQLVLEHQLFETRSEQEMSRIGVNIELDEKKRVQLKSEEQFISEIQQGRIARDKAASDFTLSVEQQKLDQRITQIRAEVEAIVAKAGAFSPGLVAALESFGHRAVIERSLQAMSPLAILGGESVADVMKKLFSGTKLADYLALPAPANGTTPVATARS